MKLLAAILVASLAGPLAASGKVLSLESTEPWTKLPRDPGMEAFVESIFRLAGREMKVPVVIDPAAKGYCGYAHRQGGQDYIGIDKACVGSLRVNGAYNWTGIATLCHEVGHILGGHTHNATSGAAEETEADEFSGWAMYRLKATLEQALARPSNYSAEGSDVHPKRSVRFESYARGWMRAKAKGPPFLRQEAQENWWSELMTTKLPWAK